MSGLCETCQYVGYCAYQSNGGAVFCEEFDNSSEVKNVCDWDLNELNRLFPPNGTGPDGEGH